MKWQKIVFSVLLSKLGIFLPAVASAKLVSPSQIPSYVPFPQASYERPVPPQGWTAATPHGGAFLLNDNQPGTIEIGNFTMWCDVQGVQREIPGISLDKIGAAAYLKNPWFGNNDYHEPVNITTTNQGTILLQVPANRVVHWWIGPRPRIPTGAKNCSVHALMRITGSAIAAVGADWWINQTAFWNGLNVNNQEIGVGNWYGAENKWQIVKMEP